VARSILQKSDPYDYVLRNTDVVEKALGVEHTAMLKQLAEAKQIIGRQRRPSGVTTTLQAKDPLEGKTGTTVKSLISQFRAAAQGRVSQEYVMSDIGSKALFTVRQREFDRLMEEALYDPNIARWLVANAGDGVKITTNTLDMLKKQMYSIGAKANVAYQSSVDDNLED